MLYMLPVSCILLLLLAACFILHIACCGLHADCCTSTCCKRGRHAIYRSLFLVPVLPRAAIVAGTLYISILLPVSRFLFLEYMLHTVCRLSVLLAASCSLLACFCRTGGRSPPAGSGVTRWQIRHLQIPDQGLNTLWRAPLGN